ncbi:transporter substrate-binding domain-containing protein [Streptomyces sp. NPDC054861]
MEIASATVVEDLAPTGVLRASINLGNPVLAHGTPEAPGGVTVDLAREVAARLGVPVELLCFDAARRSYEATVSGRADLCFLAVDPAREAEVAFTAPYVVIEGVYAVPQDSPLVTVDDVDRPGVRVGVKRGSAYDLHLSRTLRHASVVRGEDGVDAFRAEGLGGVLSIRPDQGAVSGAVDRKAEEGVDAEHRRPTTTRRGTVPGAATPARSTRHPLEVAAGIRQPMAEFVAARPDLRLIEGRFMRIRQAVGTTAGRRPESVLFLRELVEELRRDGFVADALRRAGQSDTLVAPPLG